MSPQRQAATNVPTTPAANAPIVMGGMQDANGQSTAQDAVSSVVGDIQRAGQQAIATLGGAAEQARSAAGQAIGGAASAVGTTANQIGGELQQQGGAAGQALQSSGQDVAAAAQRVPPVLGGAASNLGSAASQTAQELGSSGAANALLRQGRTQQEEDEFAQQQQQQAAQIAQQAKTNPPVIGGPGDVARNVWDLVTNSSPGLPGVSLVDYQHASTVKNDWIQQNNPVYNLPGGRPGEGQTTPASVLGDLTTQIAQQITDPYSMTMFGLTGGVGGKVIGGAAGEATTAAATDQLGEAGAKFLGTVVDKLVSGGITGGVQNALYEAEQPGADPAAVGIAALQGAGFGGVMDLGLSAAKPLMRRIGQTIIDNAPQIRQAATQFATSETGAVGSPAAVRAAGAPPQDVLHGQAVPRPGYEPGTPEHTVDTFIQDKARAQGTPTPDITAADIQSMPGMAGSRSRGLQEVRDATEAGLPAARWYQEIVQQVRQDTGQDINPREAAVLMGATGGNAGVQANYHAMLSIFDAMRQAKPDLVGLENLDVPQIIDTQAFKDVQSRVRADQAYVDDTMLARIMRGYRTGDVPVPSGAKLSSYTQDFLHALSEAYSPYSTQDVHQGRLFGARPDAQGGKPLPNVSGSDQAYRSMHAMTNWVAREMNLPPDQAQAAAWTTFRTLWNDPVIGPELRNDRVGLSDAIRQGTQSGVLDPQAMRTGGLQEVTGPRGQGAWGDKINDVRDRIQSNGSYNAPPPESASAINDLQLFHPSEQGSGAGKAVGSRKGGIPRPVGSQQAAGLRELAQGDQPILRTAGDIPLDAQGKIPWLAPEHSVQQVGGKTYVSVVGVGDDAAHAIGTRLGADRFNHADPNGSKVGGFGLDGVPAESKAAVVQALADRGLPVLHAGDTIRVPVIEGSVTSVKRAVDSALAEAGVTGVAPDAYLGTSHAVVATRSGGVGPARGQAVASGPSDLPPGYGLRAALFRDEPLPPNRAVPPETGVAAGAGAPGVSGAGGGASGGFRAPVTPDDLNVRPISQAEARQLVGGAYDPSTRTTQRPPGEGESPRRLEDVESNPHLLREPAEGETPMTTDERQAHQDNVVERYQTNQDRLAAIQEQLDNPKAKPERPPWAAGFTNDQVATMAAKAGHSPYEPLWWEKAGLESGSGEVREMLNESGVNRGDLNAQREPSPAELRQEQRALEQDQRHLEAAGEQLATAPDDARFAKPPDRNAAPLPFEHTTADPGAELAQQVVLKKGTLTSDPNQVTATRSDTGITGRGIVNPAEVVHEPPSAETKALMPNLSAIGKDMPETVAQIQKSVEDNPQLWEHYRQGTISFDSLKNDLARRVGMTKEDWLKTKVGQAFNDREMVALQAAMVEEEARQTDLAKSIMAKGGVDALTPEELAYSMASFTEAQSLAAVAKGAGSTSGRSLNARKVSFTRQLASDITAANERRAAQRTKTQATRVASRADDLLQNAKTLDQQKAVATAAASRPGQAGAPRAPKSIIDQIAQAYDELDRYNALSLHEKASVFDKLQEQRAAQAAARAAKVRGAPEELLSALKKELQWEQNNFAKRKDTWETLAFQDSKAAENAARERAGFRGGLYIEQQRKVANNALDAAQKETERAFDAEMKRRGAQGAKAQKLLESMGGQEVTKGVLKNYLAALNDPDPVVAAKFLQATASMSNWKRATIVRLAGLVSSPITMMVNIGGNAASALYEVPTHVLAGGIDAARVAIKGGERQVYAGDILPMMKAYGPGFLGQLDNAQRILTTGFTPEQLADPTKIRGRFSGSEKLNTTVEAPLRTLGASDALFRGGAMAAHGTRVAMRQARAEGFSGPQVSGRAATILKNLEDYPELAKEAADATARQVYQERRPVLGGGNQGMQNDIAEFATKQFLPFYQTPMNVTAQGVAMSPLGGVAALQSARKAAGMATGTLAERTARGSEIRLAEERAARALIGTGVLGAGIALGSAGHLTGAYPIDQKEASTLPQGWRPWSVRVDSPIDGNTYYVPLQNFNAAGFPLAMAAILTDPQHRNKTLADPDEQLNAVTAIGRYVLDNTFLQGLSDVVNTLHDPKTFAQKTGEGLAASYGPYSSLGREFQRVTGVATRNPREGFLGLWQAMEANYPGASGQVPASQTPLGDERTQAATGIGRALPLRYDIERDEPTLKVLREHGVGIPPLQKAVSAGTGLSIKLTEDEQAQLQQQQGALIRQYVTDAQADKRWAKYTDNDKAAVLKNSVAAAQRSARAQFLDKLGDAEVLKRREAKPGPEPYYLGAGAAS